jgi:hypothetical protein
VSNQTARVRSGSAVRRDCRGLVRCPVALVAGQSLLAWGDYGRGALWTPAVTTAFAKQVTRGVRRKSWLERFFFWMA